jgi:hypothetical protein
VPTPCASEQAESAQGFEDILPEPISAVDGPVELAGFRGRLEVIGLPSLLCILETERGTGMLVLNLEPDRRKARLHLSEGRVFRAHLDSWQEPRNAELVYGLIAGMRGTFDFRPSDVVLDDDIQCSTTRLIFEGARRMNEALPAPLDVHPASCRGCQDEAAQPDRSAPAPGQTLEGKYARRWMTAKGAVALAMAAFVMVVLTVWCSAPAAPDSLRKSPAGRVSFPPHCRIYTRRRGFCARRFPMSILKKAVAAVLPLLAGCFVGYEESPRQYSSSGQAEATVVVEPDVEEVNYVVYREYFGCTEAEIGYYEGQGILLEDVAQVRLQGEGVPASAIEAQHTT